MVKSGYIRRVLSLLLCLSIVLGLCTGLISATEKSLTKDIRGMDSVFLDFKVGSASRNFNWQVKSDSSKAPYFAANPQGLLAGYFKGSDPRLYMPVENTDRGNKRLGNYVLQTGDIIQVRVHSVTENSIFTTNGTENLNSYFALRTGKDATTWASCGVTDFPTTTKAQTLQWNVPDSRIGETLYGVRWDPIQPATGSSLDVETRIYVDYIYVGPAETAPVSVQFLKTDGSSFTQGSGYVGQGQKAPAWNHQKIDSETADTHTVWGWRVEQYINGTWKDLNRFVTDPSTFACYYDTRFYLTSLTVPNTTPTAQAIYTTETLDSYRYDLVLTGESAADADLTRNGTPLDVSIVIDRSGSQADLVTAKKLSSLSAMSDYLNSLDTSKWPGYYRASYWRRHNNQGGSSGYDYVYYVPMRYHNDTWEMQVLLPSCDCNGSSHRNYGIYPWNSTGMKQCSHVKWVNMTTGYNYYQDLCTDDGYTTSKIPFEIGTSRLGRTQAALEKFLQKLYNSTANLTPGSYHTVSVIGYGDTVYASGYPYHDGDSHYVSTSNYSASSPSVNLNYDNYESVLKIIRDSYVYGATRTDAALEVLSGTVSEIEKSAGKTATTLKATNYLPAAKTGRQRVVIVLTDGVPTIYTEFNTNVANRALTAARKLKSNSSTKLYTIGIMNGLDGTKPYTNSYNSGTEAQMANNFLNLLSSNYRSATSMTSPGSRTGTDFYHSDTSAGSEISAHFNSIWDKEAPVIPTPLYRNLRLYGEITPEFMPDSSRSILVYAAPYTGASNYGEKVLIGKHPVAAVTEKVTIPGNGYELELAPNSDKSGYTVELIWTDSGPAFPRETSFDFGTKATAVEGTDIDLSKGYRITMVFPLCFDYDSDPSGPEIPMLLEGSGFYLSNATGTARGSKIKSFNTFTVPVPLIGESSLISRTISLEGNISINYYMDLPQWVVNDPNAYMLFTYADGRTATVRIGDEETSYSEDTGLYIFSCQVTSKEMTDQIRCQFFYGNGKSTEESLYSVKTYTDRILSATTNQTLKDLLVSMLHYGGAAQINFNYATDTLANQGLPVPDYTQVTIDGYEVNKNQGTSLVSYAGASLLLESRTTLRLFLRPDSTVGEKLHRYPQRSCTE